MLIVRIISAVFAIIAFVSLLFYIYKEKDSAIEEAANIPFMDDSDAD